jgi:hypothetical protein
MVSRRGRSIAILTVALTLCVAALPTQGRASSPTVGASRRQPPGTQLWVARYDGPNHDFDNGRAMAVSPDGSRVFVTGSSYSGPESVDDYTTVAYDASTGSLLWASSYDGPGHSYDDAYAIAVSPDGSEVVVTGYSYGSGTGPDFGTVAYSTGDGAQLWVERYDGPVSSIDSASAIAFAPDGSKVFATGYGDDGAPYRDITTVAYDAKDGAQAWVSRYDGTGHDDDEATSIAVSPDGSRVFVAGFSTGKTTNRDVTTLAIDPDAGSTVWARRYSSRGDFIDVAQALAISADGSKVFVTGFSAGDGTSDDWVTLAYAASAGSRLWVRWYDNPRHTGDLAYSVAPAPDGLTAFVAGQSGTDFRTIGYDSSDGSTVLVFAGDGPGATLAYQPSVLLSPDGSEVFVAGYVFSETSDYLYITFAYDAQTGLGRWYRLYNGAPGNYDIMKAAAVSPDGSKVYVTGYSWGPNSGDFATLAYEA